MHTGRLTPAILCILMAVSLLAGCAESSKGEVTIWIDAPLPGARVAPGEEVLIQTHAYAGSGVAQIELSVDGSSFSRDIPDPAGGDLVNLLQVWVATTPGMHALQVAAFSNTGAVSAPQLVMVEVIDPLVISPTPILPGATLTITPTASTTPVTLTPSPIIPTDTTLPAMPPSINFNSDDDSINSGECTFLRWDVANADLVTLDGSSVGNPDARQVCPATTTNYTLRAISAGGERSESIQIQVSIAAPQDTTGPVITSVSANPGSIFDNASCGPNQSQITASVVDAGSGVKRVDIYYQVIKPPSSGKGVTTGQLRSLRMSGNENQGFSIILGPVELQQSMALYGGGTVQYYLIATDNQGNTTQSKTFTFKVEICII